MERESEQHIIKSGTRLQCFCPHCSQSLLEGDHLEFDVQGEGGQWGVLRLSPFLNTFESESTVWVHEGQEAADLRCRRCGHTLKDESRCEECHSQAARLHVLLDAGATDFFICLRRGCHWHGVSPALRSRIMLEATGFHHPDRPEMIGAGTKLQLLCPSCRAELVQGDDLLVHVRSPQGHSGELVLSPYLNDFRSRCTLEVPKGAELADMLCPHCDHSLMRSEDRCVLCGARAGSFVVLTSAGDAHFLICLRRQCHWHRLDAAGGRVVLKD